MEHLADQCLVGRGAQDVNEDAFARGGGLDAEGGRGRALMHALTDRVEYMTQPGRTIVRLVKRIF